VSATAEVLDLLRGFVPAGAAHYVDPSGAVSVGATAGVAGGFVNLDPGLYAFQLHFAGTACSASAAIAGDAPSEPAQSTATFYVDIRAGYVLAPILATCGTNP
jgi:hypothetical protein